MPGLSRGRRMRRCAPAALLWVLALYAVAQAVLFVLMDRWHPMRVNVWRDKFVQLRQLVEREPDRPLLVMLGSSRTDAAFQAGRFNDLPGPGGQPFLAYNFGTPAGGPIHQLLFLHEMLEAGVRPRLLLLEYLPLLYNAPRRKHNSEEDWTAPCWLTLSQYLTIRSYCSRIPTRDGSWLEGRLASWYAYRSYALAWWVRQVSPEVPQPELDDRPRDAWGHRLSEEPTPEECQVWLAETLRMHEPTLRHFRLGTGPVRAMRDVLALCHREGIPVVLVVPPESQLFRSLYNRQGLADAQRLLDELRTTYGLEVIDASRWVPEHEFIDGNHVLTAGADRFTTRLRQEVRRLLARKGEPGA